MAQTIGIDARKLNDFGIGTYIQNLIRSLSALDRDNEYVLFVGAQSRDVFEDLPENFTCLVENAPNYSIRELFALSWRLYRRKIDLYHATHYVLPAVVPCPSVVTIHDIIHLLYPEFLPGRLAFAYAQRMIRRSLTRGTRVIADSRNTKTDLMDYFNVDGRKIRVIYPGVSDQFRRQLPQPERDRWMKQLGIRQPYLLFVGNPKPHKNLDNVVKAYARALETHPNETTLVCVGNRDGNQFKIEQRAHQLGIGDRVLLLGQVEQDALPAVYQNAELFIYPTLYEGFGLPVVEAMASGTPVITSNTSALNEIADGYAHLVAPLETEQIARGIVRCLADEDYRERLRSRGLRRADDFHWSLAAEQTLGVYQSALSTSTARGRRGSGRSGKRSP